MPDLKGQIGELRMTVEVTRAATGKVEVYELVGHVLDEEETPEETKEPTND